MRLRLGKLRHVIGEALKSVLECPNCHIPLERRWARNWKSDDPDAVRTWFWGCPNFATEGCKVTYSPKSHKWHGIDAPKSGPKQPRELAPLPDRETIITALQKLPGMSQRSAAEQFIDQMGPEQAVRYIPGFKR